MTGIAYRAKKGLKNREIYYRMYKVERWVKAKLKEDYKWFQQEILRTA